MADPAQRHLGITADRIFDQGFRQRRQKTRLTLHFAFATGSRTRRPSGRSGTADEGGAIEGLFKRFMEL